MNILVIDDNLVNLKLACDILESENFKVQKATCAEETLTVLESYSPDLILLDIGLPGMDGYMLTKKIKNDENTKHLKIVALTASANLANQLEYSLTGTPYLNRIR